MALNSDFDVKERVKQATDVVDLIGSFISLRRQGSGYVGLCPWHDDSRPSFQVNPGRQSWACWVCDVRGDVFDFVKRIEGVEFFDALKILAERAGIPINVRQQRVEKGSKDDKQTLFKAMAWAEEQYHQCLLKSDAAIPIREYLAERGVTQESIDTFRIGFAPLSWSWLVDRARHTEYSPEILEACGLVSASSHGGWYERFRGRVLFPIRDTLDRPIAIGGRVVPSLYGDGEEIPPAKYVNSPETKLFSKSRNLYALNLCRSHVQKMDHKRLIVVEGYTDVIAAWQAGLRNVVAALGTAINEQHLQLIRRFADGVTLVLDGDEAGQKKSNSVLDLFIAHDIDLRILTLPEGMDPFDFLLAEGAAPFQALIDAAPDAIGHKILTETRGIDLLNDTHQANQALESILKTLSRVPASVLAGSAAKQMRQDQIVLRLARQFQLTPEQIKRRLVDLRSAQRTRIDKPVEGPRRKINYERLNRWEAEWLQLIMLHPSFLDTAVEQVVPDEFQEGPLQDLYRVLEECFLEGHEVGFEQVKLFLEDSELKELVNFLHEDLLRREQVAQERKAEYRADAESQFAMLLERFQEQQAQQNCQARISQLHAGQLDADAEADALRELFEYQQQRQRNKNPK